MKKRILSLLALLVFVPIMAFATEVVITWEWMLDDPQITGFRYQLDGEDPENWTVVDGMTSSCAIQHLDGSKEYTLYLQQTYDGVNWSPSALSIASPLFTEEDMTTAEVAEEVVVGEDVETVDQEATMEEEVVAETIEKDEVVVEEKVVKVKTPNDYYTSLSLRGTAGYSLGVISGRVNDYDNYSIAGGFGIGFNNIVNFGDFGLGLNLDTDLIILPYDGKAMTSIRSFFTNTTDWDATVRLTIAPEIQYNLNKLSIDFAPFVDASLVDFPYVGTLDLSTTAYLGHFVLGGGAQLGIQYNATDKLQIGLITKFRKLGGLSGLTDLNNWGVEVTPAISFKF